MGSSHGMKGRSLGECPPARRPEQDAGAGRWKPGSAPEPCGQGPSDSRKKCKWLEMTARGNGVGFAISEKEDVAAGPGTRLGHSRAFV